MIVVIFVVMLVFIGLVLYDLFKQPKETMGSIVIVEDLDDGPYMFLESTVGVDAFRKCKIVTLKVEERKSPFA